MTMPNSKPWLKLTVLAGWFFSVTLGLAGIYLQVTSQDTKEYLYWSVIGTAALMITCISVAVLWRLYARGRYWREYSYLTHRHVGRYVCRWASTDQDFSDAWNLLYEILPEDVITPLGAMRDRLDSNRRLMKLIESVDGKTKRLLGVVTIFPLNAKATKGILLGDITTGRELHGCHIAKTWRRANSIYVSVTGACTWRSRALAVLLIEQIIQDAGVSNVFARPATRDGLRVMQRAGFVPLTVPKSKIWHRMIDSQSDLGHLVHERQLNV
jgi:hypothetical protein